MIYADNYRRLELYNRICCKHSELRMECNQEFFLVIGSHSNLHYEAVHIKIK